jgi:hypothetical protein
MSRTHYSTLLYSFDTLAGYMHFLGVRSNAKLTMWKTYRLLSSNAALVQYADFESRLQKKWVRGLAISFSIPLQSPVHEEKSAWKTGPFTSNPRE